MSLIWVSTQRLTMLIMVENLGTKRSSRVKYQTFAFDTVGPLLDFGSLEVPDEASLSAQYFHYWRPH